MANAIDLIVSKNAVVELQKTYELLGKTHEEIVKISKVQLDFNGGTSPKNPAQMQKVIADFQKLEQASNQATAQLVKNKERERLAEIKLQQDREKAFAKFEAQANKEQAKLEAALNLQNRTNAQLKSVQSAYDNLAIKKARYNDLTENEEKRLLTLTNTLQKYRAIQDGVNTTVGKFQQRVGAYVQGGFNPLSNSINQLTREMPAFTNSVQTGFMAISNNLPIFFDAMGQVIAQNRELQAQGEPTQSVLKQVANALFSFQTLMGVGITLLTVYGAEIINFIFSIDDLTKSLGEVEKAQDSYNNAKAKGVSDAQNEMIALRQLMNVAKDEKRTMDERNLAIKLMRDQYPYFLKQISDQELLTGKATRAENDLTKAINANAQAQNKQTSLNTTRERIAQIDAEIQARKNYQTEYTKIFNTLNGLDKENLLANFKNAQHKAEFIKMTTQELEALKLSEKERKKRRDNLDDDVLSTTNLNILTAEKNRLEKETLYLQKFVNQNTADALLLRWKEEKQRKEKIKDIKELNIVEEDYLASQYRLNRLQLELEISGAKDISESEKMTFNERAEAYKRFVLKKVALAELYYKEQVRLENKRVENAKKNALDEYNETIKQEGATSGLKVRAKEKYNAYIYSLELQSKYNLEEIELQYTKNVISAQEEMYNKLRILREKEIQQRESAAINQAELDGLREYNKKLLSISKRTTLKTIEQIESDKTEVILNAQKKRLQLELQQIADKLVLEFTYEKTNTEAVNKLNQEAFEKFKQLNDLEIQENERKKAAQIKYLSEIKAYLAGFVNEFASSSGLPSLFKIMNDEITGFGENAFVTINATMQAFQEMYAFINQNSEAYFNAEFSRLENQKNLAIKYAGDSTAAKEEIEKQYEAKRLQLERKKAQQQKEAALFNAILNTAQAVTAFLAEANYFGAIAAGVLGAAQIAMIASQPLPAYEKGTLNHSGGAMLINDGKGSNYQETVVTPDGKAKQYKGRNVVTSAPKGTKVYTHDQWNKYLDNILMDNDILSSRKIDNSMIVNNGGISANELDSVIGKHFGKIQTNVMNIDKNGFNDYIIKGGQKTSKLSNRVTFKGLNT